MSNPITHRMALSVANSLHKYSPKEGLANKKVILGIEIILINISKALIVFLPSLILGILPQTLCVFIGFNAIRITAFGLHALTSTGCSVCSITMLTIIPYLLKDAQVSSYVVAGVGVVAFLAILKYAPADTKARPLIGKKKRTRLKMISLITCVILFSILVALPYGGIKAMVILGVSYEIVSILPITYKILGREVNNYGKYERKLSEEGK